MSRAHGRGRRRRSAPALRRRVCWAGPRSWCVCCGTRPIGRPSITRWPRWVATLPHAELFAARSSTREDDAHAWLADEDLDEDEREELAEALEGCGLTGSHGWSFARGDEDKAAVVGLWFDTQGMPGATVARLRGELRDIVDGLMTSCDGIQASLAHWGWIPRLLLGGTPYESALGLGAQRNRETAARRVRAVAETLWLSDALRRRIEAPARLSVITTQTRLGSARRLVLDPEESLASLETALAGILPAPLD